MDFNCTLTSFTVFPTDKDLPRDYLNYTNVINYMTETFLFFCFVLLFYEESTVVVNWKNLCGLTKSLCFKIAGQNYCNF